MHCKQMISMTLLFIILYLLWPHVWHNYNGKVNKTGVFQMKYFLWLSSVTPGAAKLHKRAKPFVFQDRAALY